MVNKIEVSPLAEKEIEESFDWYEKEAEGLGIRFILSIDEAINNIAEKPEAYPKKNQTSGSVLLMFFPLWLFSNTFKADSLINILHVFHTTAIRKLSIKESRNQISDFE